MVLRTTDDIIDSVTGAIQSASPQLRVDVDKGPFYYLAARGVATPLADISASVERIALLSTLQFPAVATGQEALAVARSFGITLGSGGYASGIAYAFTTRRPSGGDTFTVSAGDSFSTGSTSGGITFDAVESRTLSASNADAFFNSATRRYELPVRVVAVSAGTAGNVPAFSLQSIRSGAQAFDGVYNVSAFVGGSAAQSIETAYARTQQRLLGLDNFSRGGLVANIQNIDTSRILAVELTYSSEYPFLFYRLPDSPAVDAWVLDTPDTRSVIESITASPGQSSFLLSYKPAVSLTTVQLNGASVGASLVLDTSLAYGRSTKESSYVVLDVPAAFGDVVDISYNYDAVLANIQTKVDGYLNSSAGALFATDVLIRYPQQTPVTVSVTGSVLGTFDPTSVEEDVATVIGNYLSNGNGDAPLLGGMRTPADLRDLIRATVPGVSTLAIPIFCRKSVGPLVETIDVPRNSQLIVESTEDVYVKFI
jgi:hypothetical protein